MLFDAVVDQVGDAGWLESANDGAIRRLFRRDRVDPRQIIPWPLLEMHCGSRVTLAADWMGLDEVPAVESPAPPPPPKLRGLGPGEIRLLDGDEFIEVAYNEEGAKFETCRSHHPHPLAGLAPALAKPGGNPVELLAGFVAALDPSRHGPGRVGLPVAMPHGVGGVWRCGLNALRSALFDESVVRGARWAVADGLTGKTVGLGASREAALARWRDVVAGISPWPEPRPVEEPPEELPPSAMLIRGPSPDVPMPEAVPANVPAVVVPLTSVPADLPRFGSWVGMLGAYGAMSFGARRRKREGFTLIGQQALGSVDLERLDAEMARADEVHESRLREVIANAPGGVRRWPCRTTIYNVSEGGRLEVAQTNEGGEWNAGGLDGDVITNRVVRQRWFH